MTLNWFIKAEIKAFCKFSELADKLKLKLVAILRKSTF